jgi:MFS family permease
MWSLQSAVVLLLLETAAVAVVITPSLAYMADAVSSVGLGTFGVAYGLYNMAWGVGLLGGPAAGGWLFEHAGFSRLTLAWAVAVGLVAVALTRVQSQRFPPEEPV